MKRDRNRWRIGLWSLDFSTVLAHYPQSGVDQQRAASGTALHSNGCGHANPSPLSTSGPTLPESVLLCLLCGHSNPSDTASPTSEAATRSI